MAYLTEGAVRAAAKADVEVATLHKSFAQVLTESIKKSRSASSYDVFLSHSIKDAEIVLGAKRIIEQSGRTVYVDWIVDPSLDRSKVTGDTAEKLRSRMRQCRSLIYLYSTQSQHSRWMPWELGYFDGYNGNVAILPIVPTVGSLQFGGEEYLQMYPKIDMVSSSLFVNRVATLGNGEWKPMETWMKSEDKLRVNS